MASGVRRLGGLLDEGRLLADGAMGTSLLERGVPLGACFELLNVEDPAAVAAVHGGFVEAGARAVWTNTFGANRYRLERHGIADRLGELNRAGVQVARRSGAAVVAGSVGPLGIRLAPYGRVRAEDARAAYREQIVALAEAGADLVAIETQTDLDEIEQALAAAREACDLPVLVTATFTTDDRTLLGSSPVAVAVRLAELGADAIGANCGQGPAQVLRVVRAMRAPAGAIPLVARPNAGGPQEVGGRMVYPATPAYFADVAGELLAEGVGIVGGCCGTGPAHTAALAEVFAGTSDTARARVGEPSSEEANVVAAASGSVRLEAGPTELARKLAEGRFVIAVEVEPPRGPSAAKLVAAAETLAAAGADVLDVADSPMAKMRMSPWAACRLLQDRVGVETVLHFPTRGRNLLRLQGDLLAVHALGIRNVFICLGDPVTIGDYPHGTDNVDVTPTGVMALITGSFNEGTDRAGNRIGEPTSFVVGCALNPARRDLESEARLLRRKVQAGARFALSQPVWSPEPLLSLRAAYERVNREPLELPILAGVLPLVTARHAEFIANEVPGAFVPPEVLERMRKAGERAEAEGLAIANEVAAQLRAHAAGLYVMPQFGRFDLAAEVVEAARV